MEAVILGSSYLLTAYGKGGTRARIKTITAAKKSFRLREGAAGGRGEGEESRRARALGWEAARPCLSKEAKTAKIDSLIGKNLCARPLKNVSIFAGFARRQTASRGVGCRACGRHQPRSKKVWISSNKRTRIKLSGILPSDSAARSAAENGNTSSPFPGSESLTILSICFA